jgi:hypothetical protein
MTFSIREHFEKGVTAFKTRDEKKVVVLGVKPNGWWVGYPEDHDDQDAVVSWIGNGRYDRDRESDYDIIGVWPQEREIGWVNVYAERRGSGAVIAAGSDTRENAGKYAADDLTHRIHLVEIDGRIEIREQEFIG